MAFGDADRDSFLKDFGVSVLYGAAKAKGIVKTTDVGNPLPDQDNSNLGRLKELVVKRGALGTLSPETIITVDGTVMMVSTYDLIEEGGFTKLYLEPWNATSQDRPPSDLSDLVWAWDPDLGDGNAALLGPAGTLNGSIFWSGGAPPTPVQAQYNFDVGSSITFGDSLDNVWAGGLPWTVYVAVNLNAADLLAPAGALGFLSKDEVAGNHEFLAEIAIGGALFLRVNYGNGPFDFEFAYQNAGAQGLGRHVAALRFDPTAGHGNRCSVWWESDTFLANNRTSNGSDGAISNTASVLTMGLDASGRSGASAVSYIYAYRTAHTFAQSQAIFNWIRTGKGWI